jgi:pimeloyl-ACP methyl ester carboxylesterase
VRSWLGPAADADARERLRVMQRVALEKQVAAGDVAARDLPVRLERLTMPTLVVVGGHDRPFFVGNAQALAERLPDARLVELPWAGHLPSLERPAEADGLVCEALSA